MQILNDEVICMFAKITGVGGYLPSKRILNDDFKQFIETSDEWIQQRVGIQSRYFADEETTLGMSFEASKIAIDNAGINIDDIGAIIVATSTGDYIMPSTACLLQHELGAKTVPAFDIAAACSGFIYALDIASKYVESGAAKHVLVVGAERMSRTLDFNDRSTCILFGDGAGAVILSQSKTPGIRSSVLHSDGKDRDLLYIKNSFDQPLYQRGNQAYPIQMEGNKVFKSAVSQLHSLVRELLDKAGLSASDIDWLVPHQANIRILEATAKKLHMPVEKVVTTIQDHGNTSAASVPLALYEAIQSGKIKKGDTLLLEAFGAGFVWGGQIIDL